MAYTYDVKLTCGYCKEESIVKIPKGYKFGTPRFVKFENGKAKYFWVACPRCGVNDEWKKCEVIQ
ncbi:MAG: hypothetical protein A3K77_07100 [Euryarchaeota archaeon RBG_13_31_8]|nr:MAG: hypothetical protein A3K77_07100 [Euryarchaeota archaeon RBG_13_31_8]